MTDALYAIINDSGTGLTPGHIAQGWHFCAEWDGLLIGPGMGELAVCTCFPEGDARRLECRRMARQHDEYLESLGPIDLDIASQV